MTHFYANGMRLVKVAPSGACYFHKDHLGSTTVITDAYGEITESSEYRPFGGFRDTGFLPSVSSYLFTDQEYDSETGLYFYGARYYDPSIGRFISPDSMIPRMSMIRRV